MTSNTTQPNADAGLLDRGVGRLEPERAEDGGHDLGVHWLGGRPYMLRSDAPAPKKAPPPKQPSPHGCQECAWGKVLGCWRCGGR